MFLGRQVQLTELEERYLKNKSQLIVFYGRRRIGKSELIKYFCDKKNHLYFEGLEHEPTQTQINQILNNFSKQIGNSFISKMKLRTWDEVFDLLTDHIKKSEKKVVIVFDEFQWLACQQNHLVSLLKFYWDNHWKDLNTVIILCGSIAHFMVKKVIHSKALYGRINWELCLNGLSPDEARKMLPKRGSHEVLKYLIVFGTVPKYLEEINPNLSFDENMNRLCFSRGGFFVNEFEKIFYSQFREANNYKKIIGFLTQRNLTLTEISKKLDFSSGGGLKSYLENLERAHFIRSYTSVTQKGRKNIKYKLFDEWITFYFKFMKPHIKQIQQNEKEKLFTQLVAPAWKPWLGIGFEMFCLKHAMYLAECAGFSSEVISFGPLFSTTDSQFQIDLIFTRKNSIRTVCEIKFSDKPTGTNVIPEMEKKLKLLPHIKGETIEKMLISPCGADSSLVASQYFHHIVDLKRMRLTK